MPKLHAGITKHQEVGDLLDMLDGYSPDECPVMISTNRPDMGFCIEWIASGHGITIYEDGTWEYTPGGKRPEAQT